MPKKVRVTLTLPAEIVAAIRQQAGPRGMSRFVAGAVDHFIRERRRSALVDRLIAGYQAGAERDRAIAEEWRPAEDELWQTSG